MQTVLRAYLLLVLADGWGKWRGAVLFGLILPNFNLSWYPPGGVGEWLKLDYYEYY